MGRPEGKGGGDGLCGRKGGSGAAGHQAGACCLAFGPRGTSALATQCGERCCRKPRGQRQSGKVAAGGGEGGEPQGERNLALRLACPSPPASPPSPPPLGADARPYASHLSGGGEGGVGPMWPHLRGLPGIDGPSSEAARGHRTGTVEWRSCPHCESDGGTPGGRRPLAHRGMRGWGRSRDDVLVLHLPQYGDLSQRCGGDPLVPLGVEADPLQCHDVTLSSALYTTPYVPSPTCHRGRVKSRGRASTAPGRLPRTERGRDNSEGSCLFCALIALQPL